MSLGGVVFFPSALRVAAPRFLFRRGGRRLLLVVPSFLAQTTEHVSFLLRRRCGMRCVFFLSLLSSAFFAPPGTRLANGFGFVFPRPPSSSSASLFVVGLFARTTFLLTTSFSSSSSPPAFVLGVILKLDFPPPVSLFLFLLSRLFLVVLVVFRLLLGLFDHLLRLLPRRRPPPTKTRTGSSPAALSLPSPVSRSSSPPPPPPRRCLFCLLILLPSSPSFQFDRGKRTRFSSSSSSFVVVAVIFSTHTHTSSQEPPK